MQYLRNSLSWASLTGASFFNFLGRGVFFTGRAIVLFLSIKCSIVLNTNVSGLPFPKRAIVLDHAEYQRGFVAKLSNEPDSARPFRSNNIDSIDKFMDHHNIAQMSHASRMVGPLRNLYLIPSYSCSTPEALGYRIRSPSLMNISTSADTRITVASSS